jgi:hypothetical protein
VTGGSPARAGIRVDIGGSSLEVLLRGAGSGGQFGAFVFHHAVIAENPPHAHLGFAEVLYILDGQYEFRGRRCDLLRRSG